MPKLIATGHDPSEQLKHELVPGVIVRIGRKPEEGLTISWDRLISREHADMLWNGESLELHCLPSAPNSMLIGGHVLRDAIVLPGQQFQIGQTIFQVEGESARETESAGSDAGREERTFQADELRAFEFRDAQEQIELLSQLPQIINGSKTDVDFAAHLVELLLTGVPRADAAAVVQYELEEGPLNEGEKAYNGSVTTLMVIPENPVMMRVSTHEAYSGRFRPSRRLIQSALVQRESVIHLWNHHDAERDAPQFTVSDNLDWAFCTPLLASSCHGWCLYVSGISDGSLEENDLGGDLRFAELMAQFIGSIRNVRALKERETQFSSFFSPKVIESLTGKNSGQALIPAERDITVLFCDVRGFSKKAEQFRDDLFRLLTCVKAALAVMTNGILEFEGTIADFQGDAALGFWGWPQQLEEGPLPACRAALAIQREFLKPQGEGGLLDGFQVGIGVAHGTAIAGQIGTPRQAKVGVFGPVVNQGARLETMTKQYGVSICIDEAAAAACRKALSPEEGRLRKIARVIPKGMDTAMTVTELLQPEDSSDKPSSAQIQQFESAVDLVVAGQWDEALSILNSLDDEGPKSFLVRQMAEAGNKVPDDWSGAFRLSAK